MCMCVYASVDKGVQGRQKTASGPLELELQTVMAMSHLKRVPGLKPELFASAEEPYALSPGELLSSPLVFFRKVSYPRLVTLNF